MRDAMVERDGPLMTITMNRPERMNALSGAMLIRMYDAYEEASRDPEVRCIRWSLYPMGGSAVRLPRQIPYTHAAEILLTGKHLSAREALACGLVGHVVPDGHPLAKAREIAQVVCANGPLAIEAITRTLHECDGMELDQALRHEWEYGQAVFASEDAKEGPLAFAQKRKPSFQRR
jgi:enoyl-CoA hydratase